MVDPRVDYITIKFRDNLGELVKKELVAIIEGAYLAERPPSLQRPVPAARRIEELYKSSRRVEKVDDGHYQVEVGQGSNRLKVRMNTRGPGAL